MAAAVDLSGHHRPVGNLLDGSSRFARLDDAQIEFFHEHGYLAGVRILSDAQVDMLRGELATLMDPAHPGRSLFYEYHSNESPDPSTVLFHALGAWRVS